MGIAALIPDDLAPADVIDPMRRLSEGRTVLLLRSDMDYSQLAAAATAAGFHLNPAIWSSRAQSAFESLS